MTPPLLALVERLERAEGVEWWMNDAICRAMNDGKRTLFLADFVGSLDAALTLVPEGWVTADANNLNVPSNRGGWVWCLDNGRDVNHPAYRLTDAQAPTPAIALCIAALKAHAARGGERG